MSHKEDNYVKHLQSLSDEELNSLQYPCMETKIIDLIEVSETINKLREQKLQKILICVQKEKNKLPQIRAQLKKLFTIPEWYRSQHEKNSIIRFQSNMDKINLTYSDLLNNFSVDLDISMRQKMTETIIALLLMSHASASANLIETKLNIPRKSLIMRELQNRHQNSTKSTYVDRCIAYLIQNKDIIEGDEFNFDNDELISMAHIHYSDALICEKDCCQINTEEVFEEKGEYYYDVSFLLPYLLLIPCDITQYNNKYGFNLDYTGECLCHNQKID